MRVVVEGPAGGYRVIGWCSDYASARPGGHVACPEPPKPRPMFDPSAAPKESYELAHFPVVVLDEGAPVRELAVLVPSETDPQVAWLPRWRPLVSVLR